MERQEIKSINYLKAFLIISVVFAHTTVRYANIMPLYVISRLGNGGLAVSCFFVISGFFAGVKDSTYEKYCIRDSISYMWKHLRPLYIIYLLSCFIFLSDNVRMYGVSYIKENIVGIIKNILLIHSWVISSNSFFTISGVSWYLSVLVFLWLLTPIFMRTISLIKIQAIHLMIGIVMLLLIFLLYDNKQFISYYSIPLRSFQYIAGMICGGSCEYKFIQTNKNAFGVVGFGLFMACLFNLLVVGGTTIATISSLMIMIYLFTYREKTTDRGKMINEIGKASGFIYLLHYPVVQIGCNFLYPGLPQNYFSYLLQVLVIIIISIFAPLFLYRVSKA